jgi:hypothetical protein
MSNQMFSQFYLAQHVCKINEISAININYKHEHEPLKNRKSLIEQNILNPHDPYTYPEGRYRSENSI